MLHFIIGKAGCGKTHKIYEILESLPNPQDAYLLVPEQASFETEKQMLSLPRHKRCEVLSFSRLCHRVFQTYGGVAGTPLTEEEKLLLMAQTIDQCGKHIKRYRRQYNKPEFFKQMLAIVSECQFKGITPKQLLLASRRISSRAFAQKVKEIAIISFLYLHLVEKSYQDPSQQLEKAEKRLQTTDFWQGKTLLIDGFKDFTVPQERLIWDMMTKAEDVYITLCADAPTLPQNFQVFANTKQALKQLIQKANALGVAYKIHPTLTQNHRAQSEALRDMEAILAGEDLTHTPLCNDITICSCTDHYDQANTIGAMICDLVQNEGFRYRDIMVIAREPDHYQGALEDAFTRYHIPYFSDTKTPFSSQPLAVFAQKAIELIGSTWDTPAILTLLKTGITTLSEEDISLIEDYTFTWNINGKDWLNPFLHHPHSPKPCDPALTARLNHLRLEIISPLLALQESFKKAKKAKEFATAFYEYLQTTNALEQAQKQGRAVSEEDALLGQELTRSPALLISLLDRMVRALGNTLMDWEDFSRYFGVMLGTASLGSIPQGIDQVVLGDALHSRPAAPKIVILMNANAGVFPGIPHSGGLLTDHERATLNQMDVPLSDHTYTETAEESFLFYRAACSSSHKVIFTYLEKDNGVPCQPLTRIRNRMPNCRVISSHTLSPLIRATAIGPALEVLSSRFTHTDEFTGSLYTYFENHHPELAKTLVEQLYPPTPSLDKEIALQLFGKDMQISPSGVEVFHKCPFSYFCRYGLRLSPRTPVGMDVLSRGTMVHYVLEQIFTHYKGKEIASLTRNQLALQVYTLLCQFVDKEMGGMQEKPAAFRFQIDRLATLLETLVFHIGKEFSNSLFENKACEYKIGIDGDMPPISLPLAGGGTLYIHGVVDRVDTYEKEGITYFRIVDYKTGSKDFVLEDIYHGIGLQMLMYLFALENNGTSLGNHRVPAGVLYMPAVRASVDASSGNVEKALTDSLKMKGLVLDQEEALFGMDPKKSGTYLPLFFGKDGELSAKSSLASLEFFGKIRKHIETLLTQMGDTLQQGNIACTPLDPVSSGADACAYCDFKGACPLGAEGDHQKVEKMDAQTKKALLKGEDYGGQ